MFSVGGSDAWETKSWSHQRSMIIQRHLILQATNASRLGLPHVKSYQCVLPKIYFTHEKGQHDLWHLPKQCFQVNWKIDFHRRKHSKLMKDLEKAAEGCENRVEHCQVSKRSRKHSGWQASVAIQRNPSKTKQTRWQNDEN